MKRLLTLILSFCLIIFSVTIINAAEPQTKAGSKSIFYGFHGLSNLSVDNSSFGAQYMFAANMAFWASIGMSFITDKPSENTEDVTNNDFEIQFGFQYYIFQKGPVACFITPKVGIGFGSQENPNLESNPKISTNMFFGGASLGCEWWFVDNLSFSLDTFFGFESTKTTIETLTKTEQTQTKFGIISEIGANFILSFYF